MRPIPQLALDFIQGAEGVRLTAYRDSRGVWTIGWGHTGPEVVEGLTITLAQAISYLMMDATLAARRLATVVSDTAIQALTEHEYGALISFVFNLGAGASWGIWKDLNAGNLADVPNQMMLFDKTKVNGKPVVVEGLIHRRMAEVALWKAPDVPAALAIVQSAPVAAPPSSVTRDVATPPTEVSAKPQLKSKTFVGSLATLGLAGLSQAHGALSWVNDNVAAYAGQSDVLKHLQGEVVIALFATGAATALFAYLKNRSPGS